MKFEGKNVVRFSIDDYYLTYKDRRKLRSHNPCVLYRGPPGTHEVEMALEAIEKLKNRERGIKVPEFDKTLHSGKGDRSGFRTVDASEADIVIFEGWFVGLSHLERDEYPDFYSKEKIAQFSNKNLKEWNRWDFLDTLIALKPEDFVYSIEWRKEAERRKGGMTESEIEDFVRFYFKAIDPVSYYGKLVKEGQEGKNKLGMKLGYAKDRSVTSLQFYNN